MSDKQGAPILPPLNRGAANNGGSNGNAAQQTVSLQQVLATQGLNVLSTSGQQFVITSQVPGLTQVSLCLHIPRIKMCQCEKKRVYNSYLFK